MSHTLQKEINNVWNNTTEFKQSAYYGTHKDPATPGGGTLQRKLQKIKGYKTEKKLIKILSLNKHRLSLIIFSIKKDLLKRCKYQKIFYQEKLYLPYIT